MIIIRHNTQGFNGCILKNRTQVDWAVFYHLQGNQFQADAKIWVIHDYLMRLIQRKNKRLVRRQDTKVGFSGYFDGLNWYPNS